MAYEIKRIYNPLWCTPKW